MSNSVVELWNGSNRVQVDSTGALKVTNSSTGASSFVQITGGGNAALVGASGNLTTMSIPFTGTPTHTSAIVTTTRASVLAANANRRFLALVNDSVNTIYVAFGINAGASTGIRLNGYGGGLLLDSSGYMPLTAVDAVATGASSNLLITEA